VVLEKHYYFILDMKNKPLACSKEVWTKAIRGKRQLLVDKVDHKRIVTSFVSHHAGEIGKYMFKTTVYDGRNHIVYIRVYDDYDSAISGHKTIIEERTWGMQH
jgi:hypothetical protein